MADKKYENRPTVFQPGQSGNPSGRPKGSRNKLGEDFIADLYADWQQNGKDAIVRVRETKPEQYLKVIASLVPKDINLTVSPLDGLSDEQLVRRIRELDDALAPHLANLLDTTH